MKKLELNIKKCTDCPFHLVESDPDPNDWFCSDDVKVKCTKTKRKKAYITVACRPYNTERECDIPKWCPLSLRKA